MTKQLTLLATGDIYLATDEAADFLAPLRGVLNTADILIGNLEAPSSIRGVLTSEKLALGSKPKSILRMKPEIVSLLKDAGFHAFSLANNHGMDYGPDALVDTMDHLDDAGIRHAG